MAMKGYSTLRVPGLKPHHQMQFNVIPRIFFLAYSSVEGYSQHILSPETGLGLVGWFLWHINLCKQGWYVYVCIDQCVCVCVYMHPCVRVFVLWHVNFWISNNSIWHPIPSTSSKCNQSASCLIFLPEWKREFILSLILGLQHMSLVVQDYLSAPTGNESTSKNSLPATSKSTCAPFQFDEQVTWQVFIDRYALLISFLNIPLCY